MSVNANFISNMKEAGCGAQVCFAALVILFLALIVVLALQ